MGQLNRWHTKEDVMRDLAKATGHCVSDFSANCFVVDGRPPPPIRFAEEDEEELMAQVYGYDHKSKSKGNKMSEEDYAEQPDLVGITQLIRIVNGYEDKDEPISTTESLNDNQSTNITISISKLNPEVPEYIPKKYGKGNNKITAKNERIIANVNNPNVVNGSAENDNKSLLKREETVDLNPRDIKKLKNKLKTRIAENSDTPRKKLDRNVAISALLKLHTSESNTSTIYLRKPEEFETAPVAENCKIDTNKTKSAHAPQNPEKKISVTPEVENSEAEQDNLRVTDSIKKVNGWFDSADKPKSPNVDPKPKTPTLVMGPIMFQKKKPKTPSSENSTISTETTAKPPLDCSFVPSEFSGELCQEYHERIKSKEAKDDNIWTRLERELKKRDKIILASRPI